MKDKLQSYLYDYNEDEILYKKYYEYLKKGKTYRDLIHDMGGDYNYYIKHITPDIDGGFLPTIISDADFFKGEDSNNIAITKHNRYTPPFNHKHQLFEMIYVLSGSCIQHINHTDITLKSGQFCLVAPNSTHSISVFDDSLILNILIRQSTFEDIFYNLLRRTNAISAFFNNSLYTNNKNAYLLIDTANDTEIKNHVIAMLQEYLEKKKYYEDVLDGSILMLFSKLLQLYEQNMSLSETVTNNSESFSPILSYISEHYDNLTLSELAEHFHFSQAYCSRLIKKNTGRSFTELLRNIRFKMATFFLSNTNKPIAEISEDIGYANVEHFNRLFKKSYHITPSEYRRKNQSKSKN
ncbi:MAG: AraC family transcriptional regulator [Eubacterium sp.]|nr:AraC family transcriptional regulator [Eubacterium sp.]